MEARRQETGIQDAPGYYVWEVPGKAVAVQLRLEAIDGISAEVMRGFGAVPKRGAEVGGLLLGRIEPGDGGKTVVRVEDFEPVECGYRRGPSYLFTDDDGPRFEDACARWRQDDPAKPQYAVGYFRSNTREGNSLAIEDVELMDSLFPAPDRVVLLVRPFATKASMAGFFIREDGVFPETTPLEFPFRRRDLAPDELPPVRRQVVEEPAAARPVPAGSAVRRTGWLWLPLSFIFLLLGVLLGYQAALTMGTKASAGAANFALTLTVAREGDNLTVRWDRDAAAIKSAQRGVLEIQDGAYSKPVDLDAAHLQNGSIIYRNSSNSVRFRLVVYMNPRVSVSETLDWSQ